MSLILLVAVTIRTRCPLIPLVAVTIGTRCPLARWSRCDERSEEPRDRLCRCWFLSRRVLSVVIVRVWVVVMIGEFVFMASCGGRGW
ncbi:hypothetical protein CJJ17_11900 [Gordonia polyisoprenivorans]|nr:hypothetical protein CJJ17_11900 [Gordonia polyisoprenivorans]